MKQRFCTFELALQSLDILGSRIAATIRGLIICAGRVSITGVAGYLQADWGFCGALACVQGGQFQDSGARTIAVDGAVGARLLAIAFDLLASTFVASTRHTTPLLGLRFRCLIIAYVIGFRVFLAKLRDVFLVIVEGARAARVCWKALSCCEGRRSHGCREGECGQLWLGGNAAPKSKSGGCS